MFRALKIVITVHCIIVLILLSSIALFGRHKPIIANSDDIAVTQIVNQLNNEYQEIQSNRTRQDYRKIIEDDFNCRFYIYREADLAEGIDGQCSLLFRTITMDCYIDNFYYCSAFAHEVIHLTNLISQENFVTYQTFKYLYEHEDPEFHNFGIKVALHCLLGGYPEEYACAGEVIQYLS